MPDFITLSGPSCGHKLRITEVIGRFVCAACGNEITVIRSGNIITLKPVKESETTVQTGDERTEAEIAIKRLKIEIENLSGVLDVSTTPNRTNTTYHSMIGIFACVIFGLTGICLTLTGLILSNSISYGPLLLLLGLLSIGGGAFEVSSINRNNKKTRLDLIQRQNVARFINEQIKDKEIELAKYQEIRSRY
jgi:hypothetical protein